MHLYLFRAPVSGHHIKSVDKKRSQIAAEMSYDTRADSQIQLPLAITACQHDTHAHTHTHSHKANWQRLSTNEEHVPQTHEWLIFSEWQDKTPLDMKSRGFGDFSALIVWENLMNQTTALHKHSNSMWTDI